MKIGRATQKSPNEALLEFLFTDQRTFAWVVHNRRIIKNVVIPLSR
jgi:hypothetical protein